MLQTLLALHVFAAIWFAGGMMAFTLSHLQLLKTTSVLERVYCLRMSLRLTKTAIVPGGLTTVFFGVILALQEGYDILRTVWLSLSLLLFIYATAMGITYLTPNDRRTLRVCQEEHAKNLPGDASYHLLHRPHVIVLRLINILAVIGLLTLMIVRPPLFLP